MPYCPNCLAEYRPEFTRCADCDVELVADLSHQEISKEDDTQKLVRLARFSSVAEANMIKELLEDNDIATMVRGETDPIGATSGAAPAELMVLEPDLARARELYDVFFAGTPSASRTMNDE